MNRVLKLFLFLGLSVFFYTDPTVAQEEQISDEQAHLIMLMATPEEVNKILKDSSDVNRVFLCNTLLNTAIKSMVNGPNAQFPNYAIEKVKILIDAGADVNKVGCKGVLTSCLLYTSPSPRDS